MKKQISLALIVLFLFSTFLTPKSFAYNGGLLDGKDLNKPDVASTELVVYEPFKITKSITDNNLATSVILKPNETIWYDFPETMDIDSFQVLANGTLSLTFLAFIDGTDIINTRGVNLRVDQITGVKTEVWAKAKGIKRIILKNSSNTSVTVTEFDVFGTPSSGVVPPNPEPNPEPTGDRAILVVTLTTGLEKEFDLSITEVNAFLNWFDAKDMGSGPAKYAINKHGNNKGPFAKRTEYVIYNNILTFEVSEYTTTK